MEDRLRDWGVASKEVEAPRGDREGTVRLRKLGIAGSCTARDSSSMAVSPSC